MSVNEAMGMDSEVFLNDGEDFESVTGSLVAGLSSPVRGRPELGWRPFCVSRGEGAYLWDIAGKKYIDLNGGHGGAQLGHAHPAIEEALTRPLKGYDSLWSHAKASRLLGYKPKYSWRQSDFSEWLKGKSS